MIIKVQEILTDSLFWGPGVASLDQHSRGRPQPAGFTPEGPSTYAFHITQAAYGDILDLLLGEPFTSVNRLIGVVDRVVSQTLMHFVANFIHSG